MKDEGEKFIQDLEYKQIKGVDKQKKRKGKYNFEIHDLEEQAIAENIKNKRNLEAGTITLPRKIDQAYQ